MPQIVENVQAIAMDIGHWQFCWLLTIYTHREIADFFASFNWTCIDWPIYSKHAGLQN